MLAPKITGFRLSRMARAKNWADGKLNDRRTLVLIREIKRQQRAGRTDDALELALDVIRTYRAAA